MNANISRATQYLQMAEAALRDEAINQIKIAASTEARQLLALSGELVERVNQLEAVGKRLDKKAAEDAARKLASQKPAIEPHQPVNGQPATSNGE